MPAFQLLPELINHLVHSGILCRLSYDPSHTHSLVNFELGLGFLMLKTEFSARNGAPTRQEEHLQQRFVHKEEKWPTHC